MNTIIERGRGVLAAESAALAILADRIDHTFEQAVQLVLGCQGKRVTTGVGKAGAIARKTAATLSSTGSPALFLHPAEGVHGDLGVVTPDDIVLAFSYSGESDEVTRILPTLKRIGAPIVAFTGNAASTLGQASAVVLDISVSAEACPLGLAPTTSAIAMLAMADAIALATMEARSFTREDFALYHPAGALGRRLTMRASDVMRTGDSIALVSPGTVLRDVLFAITNARAGCAFVVDQEGQLIGMVTDGDVRRTLIADPEALAKPAAQMMNRNPLTIIGDPLAAEALSILEESPKRPGEAPVVDSDGRPVGLIMLKDLLRCGIV